MQLNIILIARNKYIANVVGVGVLDDPPRRCYFLYVLKKFGFNKKNPQSPSSTAPLNKGANPRRCHYIYIFHNYIHSKL